MRKVSVPVLGVSGLLLGEQWLQVWVEPDFGAEAKEASGTLQKHGLCSSAVEAIACCSCSVSIFLPLHPLHCTVDFVIVLLRGAFTPQSLRKVVIETQSSGVKQNWCVSFSRTCALLPWPSKDKCLIQTNPRRFSERLSLLHSCCQEHG